MQHVYRLAACLALWVTTASLHAQNITVYADFNLFEIFGATETSVGSHTKNGITIKNIFRTTEQDVTPEGLRLFSSTISDEANLLLFDFIGVANASNYRLLGYTIAPHPADPNLDGDESLKL
jgi:hypothetical protein